MKIDFLISILVSFTINYSVLVKSEQLLQQGTENASCTAGNDNLTIIEPNQFLNPVEYGDLRNYIPGLVSQIASIAIQGVTNDRTEITPSQKEIASHVEGLNRIKKTIEIPPLRNNLIIIGKSDDARVKLMTNCDNTELPPPIEQPLTECTSEKQNILEQTFVDTKNVKVQLDIPADINVFFNMEVQNGTDKFKNNSEFEEKNFDYPFKFSKPCVSDKEQNCCNLTLTPDDKIKHCQKCMCSHTPNKKCECCSLNNDYPPNNIIEQDGFSSNSEKSDFSSINDPKFMMKNPLKNMMGQDESPRNVVVEDSKHVEKRNDLPSNRNNIIIIGKDDVHVNAIGVSTSTVCEGIFSSKEGHLNESSSDQRNSVKVRLDVPMDSKLFFNITVTNGTTEDEKCEASFSDPDCVYPKLSLAALKSVLDTYKTKKNNTESTTTDSMFLTTTMFMKKDNTTTIYSQDSSTHKVLDKNLKESSSVKVQINSVTSPLKKKSRKKFRKVNKNSEKAVTNGTDEIHKKKSKNICKNSTSSMGSESSIDITPPNFLG